MTGNTRSGPNIISAYGDGGFRIAGERYEGSLIVLPTQIIPWPVTSLEQLVRDLFAPLAGEFEVLLIGCGALFDVSPRAAKDTLANLGFSIDVMDTGAACRTYNVLVAEGRPVAAALIAID